MSDTRTPLVHTFGSTVEAYNASQCDDEIRDGDVLSVPSKGVVGILQSAWPTALTAECGEFHGLMLAPELHASWWEHVQGGRYAASWAVGRTVVEAMPAPAAVEATPSTDIIGGLLAKIERHASDIANIANVSDERYPISAEFVREAADEIRWCRAELAKITSAATS